MDNMFENYDLTPASYVPCNLHSPKIGYCNVIKPLEEYNAKGELIGYSWNYGDSIALEFYTTGNVIYDEDFYEDAETYLEGKVFRLDIYDFRYEVVYEVMLPAAVIATTIIDKNSSARLVKGVYRCSLTLIDESGIEYTLVDGADCILMIK